MKEGTTLLAVAVGDRGVVDPSEPVLRADDEALLRGRAAFETIRVLYWTPTPVALALVSELADHYDALRERGQRLISLRGVRADESWLLPGVKSTSYAVNMAAEAEAKRQGADDAVFVDAKATVLEGPTTNVWWRREHTLYTPSLDLGILAGVTRATVIELAGESGYEVEEGHFGLAELRDADEAFTSSSVREVMPVTDLDGVPIARGRAADELQAALRRAAEG